MSGKQVKLPRSFRMCTLCFEEVEDAEHTLFRCPCFKKLRTAFLEGTGLAARGRTTCGERSAAWAARQGARAVEVDDERRRGARHAIFGAGNVREGKVATVGTEVKVKFLTLNTFN